MIYCFVMSRRKSVFEKMLRAEIPSSGALSLVEAVLLNQTRPKPIYIPIAKTAAAKKIFSSILIPVATKIYGSHQKRETRLSSDRGIPQSAGPPNLMVPISQTASRLIRYRKRRACICAKSVEMTNQRIRRCLLKFPKLSTDLWKFS